MKTIIIAAALIASATTSIAAPCADRTKVVEQLENRFGEVLHANAVSQNNNVLEIYASENAETWSITVFLPEKGLSCLAATGKGTAALKTALNTH